MNADLEYEYVSHGHLLSEKMGDIYVIKKLKCIALFFSLFVVLQAQYSIGDTMFLSDSYCSGSSTNTF